MKIKYVAILVVAGFAFGYYAAPAKIERVEVEKVVEKRQLDTELDKHEKTVTFEKVKPDGTIVRRTTNVKDMKKDQKLVEDKSKETVKTEKIEKSSGTLSVLGMVGVDQFSLTKPPVYGLSISRNILGPIAIGFWGFSNKSAGFSLGLTF